tara:strand:- start:2924 stop:3568 length:645 start_codon:yes stop_codon:yes gene_type:complete
MASKLSFSNESSQELHENRDKVDEFVIGEDMNGDYYTLYMYLDDKLPQELKSLYKINADSHNLMVKKYLGFDNGIEGDGCYDSGFDLICPDQVDIMEQLNIMIDHKIVCAMKYKNKFVSYYLYSRSSTPIKTPLRLANSVGIIDSGYRGHIKAYFDVVMNFDLNRNIQFNVNSGARYVQLCPSCIDKPMMVVLVDDISMFGKTNRSDNGFGSSG